LSFVITPKQPPRPTAGASATAKAATSLPAAAAGIDMQPVSPVSSADSTATAQRRTLATATTTSPAASTAAAWPGVRTAFEQMRQQKALAGLDELRSLMMDWLQAQKRVHPGEAYLHTIGAFDDVTLCRFLRARDGDVLAAKKQLVGHLEWRQAHKLPGLALSRVRCALCERDASTHCYFFMGHDIFRRAVMYSNSARATHMGANESIWHIVTEIENELDDVNGVAQLVWVVDFNGFQAKHSNPELGRLAAGLFQAKCVLGLAPRTNRVRQLPRTPGQPRAAGLPHVVQHLPENRFALHRPRNAR
jgi:hypothetical protein